MKEMEGHLLEGRLFRKRRLLIEDKLESADSLLTSGALRKGGEQIEVIRGMIDELALESEGRIQGNAISRLTNLLSRLSDQHLMLLDKKEASIEEDGNIAFKCNWNDREYLKPCRPEAYEYNISMDRAWCVKQADACQKFAGVPSLQNNTCYDVSALKEMYFAAGWDHPAGRKKPRIIRSVKNNKVAFLRTVPPGCSGKERLIIGCLFIKRVENDPDEETKIYGDKEKSFSIPFEKVKVRFWDYYQNSEYNAVWSSGLFRYISDETTLRILKAVRSSFQTEGLEISTIDSLINEYI